MYVVTAVYNAYGDVGLPTVAGIWETKEKAEEHLRMIKSIPVAYMQPRPGLYEGHVKDFVSYDFDIVECVFGVNEDFDPWKSITELRERGWDG